MKAWRECIEASARESDTQSAVADKLMEQALDDDSSPADMRFVSAAAAVLQVEATINQTNVLVILVDRIASIADEIVEHARAGQ